MARPSGKSASEKRQKSSGPVVSAPGVARPCCPSYQEHQAPETKSDQESKSSDMHRAPAWPKHLQMPKRPVPGRAPQYRGGVRTVPTTNETGPSQGHVRERLRECRYCLAGKPLRSPGRTCSPCFPLLREKELKFAATMMLVAAQAIVRRAGGACLRPADLDLERGNQRTEEVKLADRADVLAEASRRGITCPPRTLLRNRRPGHKR